MGPRLVWIAALAVTAAVAQTVPPPPAAPAPKAHSAMRAVAVHGTYLGVGVADVDNERAKALKLTNARGAEITMVNEGTPAAKAGIKVGDVILEYNGQPVQGKEELQRLVRETPPGRQVKIEVWRNGAPLTLTATVEEGIIPRVDPDGNWPFGSMNMPPMPAMPSIDIPHMLTTMQSAALGVECESLANNSQLAEFFGVKDGLLVRSVSHNSAADKAGVKAGDVIVKIGETHVANSRDLAAAVRESRGKGTLAMTVVRNRHDMTVNVTLEDGPGAQRFN